MLPPNRRTFLGQLAAGLGGAWITVSQAELLAMHEHVHKAAATQPARFVVFTPDQALEIQAVASEIIPSDSTPGATEAHVVYFIDRVLSTFGPQFVPSYRDGLVMLQSKTRELFPTAATFSALQPTERRQVLRAIEKTEFFQNVRGDTIAGFLCDPARGGNANEVGWKHIGFTPQFAYQPPFGDYDAEVTRSPSQEQQ